VRETGEGEYQGSSELTWSGKSTRVQYTYRTKSDSRTSHHEFDAEMKSDGQRFPSRHAGLLRMSRAELQLKSRVDHEGSQLYNYEMALAKNAPQRVTLETRAFTARGE